MKAKYQEHPDLLAFAEGRMEPGKQLEAERHVTACAECRRDLGHLNAVLEHLNKVVFKTRQAYQERDQLASEMEMVFGPDFVLSKNDMIYTLNKALQKKLEPRPSTTERLAKVFKKLTNLDEDSVMQLARKVTGGSAPLAAPAMREHATEIDEAEESKPSLGDEDKEAGK